MKNFTKAFSGVMLTLSILWAVFFTAMVIYSVTLYGVDYLNSWSYISETRVRVDGMMQLVAHEGLWLPLWAHWLLLAATPVAATGFFRRHCRKF